MDLNYLENQLTICLLSDDRYAQVLLSARWRKVLGIHRRMLICQRFSHFRCVTPSLIQLFRRQLDCLAELLSILSQTETELQNIQDNLS